LTDTDFGGLLDWAGLGDDGAFMDDTSEYEDYEVSSGDVSDTGASDAGSTSAQSNGSQAPVLDGQLHTTRNADGTTSSYQGTTATSKSTDSNGNTTTTTTTTVTTQTLNPHGDIVPNGTTTTTTTTSQTVDSGKITNDSTTKTVTGLQDNSAQAQSMRSGALTSLQRPITDWVPMPKSFMPGLLDFFRSITGNDVLDAGRTMGDKVRQNPALYCPSRRAGCGVNAKPAYAVSGCGGRSCRCEPTRFLNTACCLWKSVPNPAR
jgi:hypothetical protein